MSTIFILLIAALSPGPGSGDVATAPEASTRASLAQIEEWVGQLGSHTFRARQAATRQLAGAGADAIPLVAKAVRNSDPEVSRRAVSILVELCLDADAASARAARATLESCAASDDLAVASGASMGLRQLEQRAVVELQQLGASIYQREGQYRVSFDDSWQGGDAGLAHLVHLRAVAQLSFSNADVTDTGLINLEGRTDIEHLAFYNVPIRDSGLAIVRSLGKLQSLSLVNSQVSSAGLEHLEGLGELSSLSLYNARAIDDRGMLHLAHLTELVALDLTSTQVTDKGLAYLQPLTKLQSLSLNNTQVSDLGIDQLQLNSLQQLHLHGTEVSDAGLAALDGLATRITYLDLGHTKVSDLGLAYLRDAQDLWYLDLSGTLVTDEGLVHLSQLPNLRNLKLSSTRVRGFGLEHLRDASLSDLVLSNTMIDDRGMTHLRGLTVNSLWLDRTKVTGDGLQVLRWVSELERLYLNHTAVDDAALQHFQSSFFSKLRLLDLSQTRVTAQAGNLLKRTLPRCAVRF